MAWNSPENRQKFRGTNVSHRLTSTLPSDCYWSQNYLVYQQQGILPMFEYFSFPKTYLTKSPQKSRDTLFHGKWMVSIERVEWSMERSHLLVSFPPFGSVGDVCNSGRSVPVTLVCASTSANTCTGNNVSTNTNANVNTCTKSNVLF